VNAVFAQEGLTQTLISADSTALLPSPASRGYYGAIEGKNAKEAGYPYGPDTDVSEWNRSWAGTAGGAQSTIEEMAKWAASGLGTNLLSEKTAAERLHPASLGLFGLNEGVYGLGIGVRGDWIGHAGQLIGWESVARYNTKTGAVLVVLANSSGGLSAGEQAASVIMPDITQPWAGLQDALATADNLPPGVPRPGASPSASSS
jgi:D-alanyl-D-alanine carboxypeptidase